MGRIRAQSLREYGHSPTVLDNAMQSHRRMDKDAWTNREA